MTDEEESVAAAQQTEDASRGLLDEHGDRLYEALILAILACSSWLESLYHQRERHQRARGEPSGA